MRTSPRNGPWGRSSRRIHGFFAPSPMPSAISLSRTSIPRRTREFCRGNGAPTRWWERKDEALRGFFAWLVNRGHLAACPLQRTGPVYAVLSSPTSIPAMNCSAFSMQRRFCNTAASRMLVAVKMRGYLANSPRELTVPVEANQR